MGNRDGKLGTSVDYSALIAKYGKFHHPACSNASPNHNTNPNLLKTLILTVTLLLTLTNPNPNANPKLLQCIFHGPQ